MVERRRQVLLAAASSGDGQFRHLIDPELRRRLAAVGIDCYSIFLPQLTPEHLAAADTVVLLRFPLVGHCRRDYPDFQAKFAWFYDFVRNGGNLVMMFAESYGRSETAMNEFAAPWNIAFAFNHIVDRNPQCCRMLPLLDGGRMVRCEVVPGLPGLPDTLTELDLIVDGGHGTQQLTCYPTDSAWQPLLCGSATCRSEPFPQGLYGGGGSPVPERPLFGVWRRDGDGLVMAFPGASPFWLANAFLPRWRGTLMRQHHGAGFQFIQTLLNQPHARARSAPDALTALGNRPTAARDFSFRYATEQERRELASLPTYRVWIGTIPDGQTAASVLADARNCGCVAAVVVYDWAQLDPDQWRRRRAEFAAMPGILAAPGYEQIDGEGNASVVFNVDELPDQRLHYPNSNLLEDLLIKLNGYSAVYARPEANRLPFWRQGGYNLLEVGQPGEQAIFRECVASAGFIGGVHLCRGVMPSAEREQTWVLAATPADWKRGLTENLHLSQVTAGPRLTRLELDGLKLIVDDWEGYWYEWEAGQSATVHLELASDAAPTEVTLWDGTAVLCRFTAADTHIVRDLPLRAEADWHLHVTARDARGRELLCSWPLHTRNRFYWAHCGSDQMNDYHNVFEPAADGFLGIGDRYYEPYGFVTCGRAWGDYLRITPPVPWSDLMPTGLEVSSLAGNFKSFHPSPFVLLPSGPEWLNNPYRRLGRCTQEQHLVVSDADSSWRELPGAVWTGHGGRLFTPTRAVIPSPYWRCQAVYTIPRWRKYCPCRVGVAMTICWRQAVTLAPGQTISFAHSLHQKVDGLQASGIPGALAAWLQPGLPQAEAGEKEWDTLGVLPLLSQPATPSALHRLMPGQVWELTGDPAVTYDFTLGQAPGTVGVRGWHWTRHAFVLSYELNPEQRQFRAGDQLTLNYEIGCGIGTAPADGKDDEDGEDERSTP